MVSLAQVMAEIGNADAFLATMTEADVPQEVAEHLVISGLSFRLFSALAIRVEDFDSAIEKWVPSEMLATNPAALPALRLLWIDKRYPNICASMMAGNLGIAPAPSGHDTATAPESSSQSSWAETFAPKLSATKIQESRSCGPSFPKAT